MRILFILFLLTNFLLVNAQAPSIVKTVSGAATEPKSKDQEGWKNNEWNGLFFYQGTGSGVRLCVTDGTNAGTVFIVGLGTSETLIKTIPAQDFMYIITSRIASFSPFTFENQIWKSDGTAGGTSLVYTMSPAGISNANLFTSDRETQKNFSVSGNTMFFNGYDATNGNELWITDGTNAGTHIVKDIKAGTGGSNPWAFCKIGTDIFFTCTQTGLERKLWKTDGTDAGTVQIPVAEPFYILDNAVGIVNNKMIFYAHNTVDGYEPYVSDGTAGGTFMLKNINPSGNSWINVSQNAHLYFNSKFCFFIANNGTARALWRTDGTTSGTIQLTTDAQNMASDVSGGGYTAINEEGIWAIQYVSSGANNMLYRSDGTVAGTYQVASGLSYAQYLKIYQNGLWMQSRNIGSPANSEPWRSGGNAATTKNAFEIEPGNSGPPTNTPLSSDPYGFFVKNNKLYFFATTSIPSAHNLYQYTGDFTFNGSQAAGRWSDNANWNGLLVPGITDIAYVNAGTPNTLNIDGATAFVGNLVLGNNAVINTLASTDSLIINDRITAATGNSFTGAGVLALNNINTESSVTLNNGFSANRLAIMSNTNLQTGDINVSDNSNLINNSLLTLNTGNVILTGSSSTISHTGNSYFNTNGTGRLFIENIGATGRSGSVVFPVGTNNNYNPTTITNAGTDDKFGVRVKAGLNGNYTGEEPDNSNYISGAVGSTWFVTEGVSGGSDVTLQLQWTVSQELNSFDRSQTYLGHYTGGSWNLGSIGVASGSDPYTFSRTGITSFSPFGIVNSFGVLPLKLISFTSQKCNNNQVCLNWKTANEQNVSYFEIQRSLDGRTYTTIKPEQAKNQPLNLYSYVDDISGISSGKIYYRIKQVDADAKYFYSPVQFISQTQNTEVVVYPNPAKDKIIIHGWENIKRINIYDLLGRIVAHSEESATMMNVAQLASGIYTVKIFLKDNTITNQKLIKE